MSAGYIKKLCVLLFACIFSILLAFTCNYQVQQAKTKIKLKSKKLEMYVGDTYRFKLKKCTYRSSDKKVVSVSKKGKVKAKKAGNAKITVREKNSKAKAVCRIKVGRHATGIKITGAATILLKSGQTATISTEVSPKKVLYKGVTYTVSDNNIISVNSNGVITPKSSGVATVTATTKAVDVKGGTLSSKVTVVVQDDNISTGADLGDSMEGYKDVIMVMTPVPTVSPTPEPTPGPSSGPTSEPSATGAPVTTPTAVPTSTPIPTPTSTPSQTIDDFIQSVVPDENSPLAAAFVVSNSSGEVRTIYLLNKEYSGYMSATIDGYSYSANKSVMEFLTKLQNETGSVTNSAGTINVMRRYRKDSWKVTFLETGVIYYFSGKITDDIYNSQFGIMIAEGNTLDNIVISGQ